MIKKLFIKPSSHPSRSIRIANRDGKLQVDGLGVWHSYWRDPYHLLLTIPWIGFAGIICVGYIGVNVIFALLYLAGGDCLSGAQPGSFADAFFFSVHTLGSIGYGVIAPKTNYANIIVTLEAIASLLTIAVVTGLAFARFSRPISRVIFSEVGVISLHNRVPTLMFRAANQRRNQILEAQARLYFTRDEITAEGESIRRFYELKLSRYRNPTFSLTWSLMHSIDEHSPLWQVTSESLAKSQAQFIVSLSGIDDITSYVIHDRRVYGTQDILWNYKFADVIYKSPTGDRYLDYTYFHSVLPIEPAKAKSREQIG